MVGKYRLSKEIRVRVGVTSFSTPKGKELTVKQHDKERSKVLIDFGGGYIDWFHENWLNHYAEAV